MEAGFVIGWCRHHASAKTILIDGDTINVDGTRIRIAAIDTPETFRPRCHSRAGCASAPCGDGSKE